MSQSSLLKTFSMFTVTSLHYYIHYLLLLLYFSIIIRHIQYMAYLASAYDSNLYYTQSLNQLTLHQTYIVYNYSHTRIKTALCQTIFMYDRVNGASTIIIIYYYIFFSFYLQRLFKLLLIFLWNGLKYISFLRSYIHAKNRQDFCFFACLLFPLH